MSAIGDDAARRAALDPERSFIVQAPAGSGKTELLIQRYLTLLARVDEPEQVVAITFTRKAAAEMRSRVLRALASTGASRNDGDDTLTARLARAAAARDAERGWRLAEQPHRLKIDTLDALNVWLARQLPILAGGIAGAAIVDDATEQHRVAARRTLGVLAEGGELGTAARLLAVTFGNDLGALEQLLAELLPKRDQWLPHLLGPSESLKVALERALARLVGEELDALASRWPEPLRAPTAALLAHVAQHAEDATLRVALAPFASAWPTGADALDAWRGAAEVWLTRNGDWRRAGDKRHGLGAAQRRWRDEFAALRAELERDESLGPALAQAAALPAPHYSDAQWRQLEALRLVLTRLVAELRVVFAERRAVDFIELALAAQQALGRVDRPSELLLALDRRIQHVLVDEFQDTSQSQLKLLERLTSGWQPGDGRTLFLVGDPMQSIYRFRDADLTRFLNVKRHGLGGIRCESLVLERNFRSSPAVVDWLNERFQHIFPAQDDPNRGMAGFHACTAVRSAAPEHGVHWHCLRSADPRDELRTVAAIVADELARYPERRIGILVQSRTHLAGLHEHLSRRGWPVRAVEIDTLTERQVGQDLLALTRALVHPADRIAWLALLRGPWCGLEWRDLEALCGAERERTISELLHDDDALARLGPDGAARALALRDALAAAVAERRGRSLAATVAAAWERLDGGRVIPPAERPLVERFLALLGEHERHGNVPDPARLAEALGAAPQPVADSAAAGVEILTMHRAKGLEFDTVVLFGLGREVRRDDPKALYWLERTAPDGGEELILAPPTPPEDGGDRLAEFVRAAGRRRDLAERARLLYVAATRARDRLHLVCRLPPGKSPPPASMLALLWPAVAADFPAAPDRVADEPPVAFEPRLVRRRVPAERAPAPPAPPVAATTPFAYEWVTPGAVDVGTVVHRYLHRIAADGLEQWSAARVRAFAPAFRRELEMLGVDEEHLDRAVGRVVAALEGVLGDERGRWLLGTHDEAESELALTEHRDGALRHLRLDRTFVDGGTRWIVDFKTSAHEGGAVQAFLAAEVERYRVQLERYANAIAALDARPIKVGLYFPLLREFRSWEPFKASR